MKTGVIIQARLTSTRMPGKVLMPLKGKPLLFRVLERCEKINNIDLIVVAIPDNSKNNLIEKEIHSWKKSLAIKVCVYKGDEENVLLRTYKAAYANQIKTIIRITSDCPFIDPIVSGSLLNLYKTNKAEYARLSAVDGFPIGFETEIFETFSLKDLLDRNLKKSYTEHVTPFFWKNPEKYNSVILSSTPDYKRIRLVVDTQEDMKMATKVYEHLYNSKRLFNYNDIKNLIKSKPDIFKINQHIKQKTLIGKKC